MHNTWSCLEHKSGSFGLEVTHTFNEKDLIFKVVIPNSAVPAMDSELHCGLVFQLSCHEATLNYAYD